MFIRKLILKMIEKSKIINYIKNSIEECEKIINEKESKLNLENSNDFEECIDFIYENCGLNVSRNFIKEHYKNIIRFAKKNDRVNKA